MSSNILSKLRPYTRSREFWPGSYIKENSESPLSVRGRVAASYFNVSQGGQDLPQYNPLGALQGRAPGSMYLSCFLGVVQGHIYALPRSQCSSAK